jgi:Malonate decarboxylase, alpha subunit, transporter
MFGLRGWQIMYIAEAVPTVVSPAWTSLSMLRCPAEFPVHKKARARARHLRRTCQNRYIQRKFRRLAGIGRLGTRRPLKRPAAQEALERLVARGPPGGSGKGESLRGRKLVVQMVQTHQPNGAPSFVERLDAFDLAASAGFALPPIMIYGDDVTHVITERGVANLLRCRSMQEREAALRAVAGDTEFGRRQSPDVGDDLRRRGIVMFPADLGIDVARATRDWLADNRRPRDGLGVFCGFDRFSKTP